MVDVFALLFILLLFLIYTTKSSNKVEKYYKNSKIPKGLIRPRILPEKPPM